MGYESILTEEQRQQVIVACKGRRFRSTITPGNFTDTIPSEGLCTFSDGTLLWCLMAEPLDSITINFYHSPGKRGISTLLRIS